MSDTEVWPALICESEYFPNPLTLVATYGEDGELPIYSDLIDGVADRINAKVGNDGQFTLIISGPTGSGKSNLALQIIRKLDKNFELEDVYIYSAEDLAKKLKRKSTQIINWFDEGSITLNSLNTTSKRGLLFSQFWDTMRLKHYINIICMPEKGDLNKRIGGHVDMFLYCPRYAPLPYFKPRGFFDAIVRIFYKSGKFYDKTIGTGTFRKVPKRLRDQYESIKKERANQFEQKFIEEMLKDASDNNRQEQSRVRED